jgi:hypothetical protein
MKIYKFIAFFAILMFNVSAYAADTAHIGDYKYWSVYRTAEGVKYMVSYPIADEGNFAKRERPYFMITNFNGTIEVSAYVGYYYKKDSEPKITVYLSNKDPKKVENFAFYTKNDMAWNKDAEKDASLVGFMKNGDKIVITSESTKNTGAKDTYSLDGFSAAYNEIMK